MLYSIKKHVIMHALQAANDAPKSCIDTKHKYSYMHIVHVRVLVFCLWLVANCSLLLLHSYR